ncbi:unnamed protein product [Ostreobium quekettii]|uniref:Uncharacterized protein n=1 Tax=Ostreobium quekettii TaxID=121088 RepID=A0A8S1J3D7_9CHLO|nr:unnamed protein product [Ostreobium quekettii]
MSLLDSDFSCCHMLGIWDNCLPGCCTSWLWHSKRLLQANFALAASLSKRGFADLNKWGNGDCIELNCIMVQTCQVVGCFAARRRFDASGREQAGRLNLFFIGVGGRSGVVPLRFRQISLD